MSQNLTAGGRSWCVHYVFLTGTGSQFTHTRPSPCEGPGKFGPRRQSDSDLIESSPKRPPLSDGRRGSLHQLNAAGKRATAIDIGAALSRTHVHRATIIGC